jgi:hypothetical protein
MRDDIFTPDDLDKLIRIRDEAMGDPHRKILPKRIYPDDAIFLLDLLWSVVKRIKTIHPPGYIEPDETE